jgi:hypothetical protein
MQGNILWITISLMFVLALIPHAYAQGSNTSPLLTTATSIKSYKNSTYGITSVQYPSDWSVNETNGQRGTTSLDIVTFYPPFNSY